MRGASRNPSLPSVRRGAQSAEDQRYMESACRQRGACNVCNMQRDNKLSFAKS